MSARAARRAELSLMFGGESVRVAELRYRALCRALVIWALPQISRIGLPCPT
jgi:hypothetical protein